MCRYCSSEKIGTLQNFSNPKSTDELISLCKLRIDTLTKIEVFLILPLRDQYEALEIAATVSSPEDFLKNHNRGNLTLAVAILQGLQRPLQITHSHCGI